MIGCASAGPRRFRQYNFTVNEAEPLEKEVAIDPEMLGKVFENLIEENRRKGLGAYYTPREIVHYNRIDTPTAVSGSKNGSRDDQRGACAKCAKSPGSCPGSSRLVKRW